MENQLPSNKKFGLLFTVVFLILSGYFYIYEYSINIVICFLFISFIFVVITLIKPIILKPLNVLWFKLSIFLSKIFNPIILGIIFFLLITPIAIVARLFKRDILKIKYINKITYWINKNKVEHNRDSFKKQY